MASRRGPIPRAQSASTHHDADHHRATPECCWPLSPVFDRGGAGSAQRCIGARSCVSVRHARRLRDPCLATPSPPASTSHGPNSANPTDPATTARATIPIVRAAPPSEPGPRFPPLRLLGRLPPECVAPSISGRRPRTLNKSRQIGGGLTGAAQQDDAGQRNSQIDRFSAINGSVAAIRGPDLRI